MNNLLNTIAKLRLKKEEEQYQRLTQELDPDKWVVLPPELTVPVNTKMAVNANGNYNYNLFDIDNFVQDVVIPQGGMKRIAIVWVLDTGARYRSDWLTKDGQILQDHAKDFTTSTSDDYDNHRHSSHVASSYVGKHPNFQMGLTWHPQLKQFCFVIPLKVLGDNGSGQYAWIQNGYEYAFDTAKKHFADQSKYVHITNASLGGGSSHAGIDQVLRESSEWGFFHFAAAGNSGDGGENQSRVGYPGRSKYTLAVGAVNEQKLIASFSSRSSKDLLEVDFVGGGVAVIGAGANQRDVLSMSGTSMATPNTGATAAYILSAFPEIQNVDDLKYFLSKPITDLPLDGSLPGRDRHHGDGIFVLTPYDEEPGDKPDDPVDDPDDPAQPRPKRAVHFPVDGLFPIWWKHKAMKEMELLDIYDLEISITGTAPTGDLYISVVSFVNEFFNDGRRALVLPENWDYDRAIFFTGYFIKLIGKNAGLDLSIKSITGETKKGYAAKFEEDDYIENRFKGIPPLEFGVKIDNVFISPSVTEGLNYCNDDVSSGKSGLQRIYFPEDFPTEDT